MDLNLTGRTALVTGAASGIGRAAAAVLATEGARVVGVDIDPGGLKEGVAELAPAAGGREHIAVAGDLSHAEGVAAAMRDALAASGTQLVTVALRRADLSGKKDPFANILEFIDPKKYLLLPNTSGAINAGDNGEIRSLTGNQLVRTRQAYASRGLAVLVVDAGVNLAAAVEYMAAIRRPVTVVATTSGLAPG